MSMINYASREINCKIVYYGPGLGGKTTNLETIYGKVAPDTRGKMVSLATETERTLFFKELHRILKREGELVIVEHLRDLPNFLAYTIGFFHYWSSFGFLQDKN